MRHGLAGVGAWVGTGVGATVVVKKGPFVVVGASHSGHAAQAYHSHLRAFQGLFLCFFE